MQQHIQLAGPVRRICRLGVSAIGILATCLAIASPASANHISGAELTCFNPGNSPVAVGPHVRSTVPYASYPFQANRKLAYIPAFGNYKAGKWSWSWGKWAVQRETMSGVGPWISYPDGQEIHSQEHTENLDGYQAVWNYVYDYGAKQGEWALSHTPDGSWYCKL
jgi:hypothetical protein